MTRRFDCLNPFLALLALTACSDVQTTDDATFVIRGKAMTGAHTRTPVKGGYVQLFEPAPSKFMKLAFYTTSGIPNKAVTNSDGSFTFKVDATVFTSAYPMFLGVSDSAGTLTMLSVIPQDLASAGAELTLDITETTTVQAQMICPGGIYPSHPPGYCYSDPNASTTRTQMLAQIDISFAGPNAGLNSTGTLNWGPFITSMFTNDANLLNAVKAIASGAGLSTTGFTASAIQTGAGTALWTVNQPTPADANDPSPPDSSSSGDCMVTWHCSSYACSLDMGGYNGTSGPFPSLAACTSWRNTYDMNSTCSSNCQ